MRATSQVQEITGLCRDDIEGKRDWSILGLFLGAGLKRAELLKITFAAFRKDLTPKGVSRDVLDVTGIQAKDRTVPISPILSGRLREWREIAGGGNIARSYGNNKLGKRLTVPPVFEIVRKYGERIGVPS